MHIHNKFILVYGLFISWFNWGCINLEQVPPLPTINISQEFTSQPIEQVFPGTFKNPTGIYVKPQTIANLPAYAIQAFPEPENNRNHYDERPINSPIEFLVMHYTVGNFLSSTKHFTSNIPSGRVSIHYMVAEKEDALQLQGGELVQVVPESKRAWHAGPSFWRGFSGLNSTSIGMEAVNPGYIVDPLTQLPSKWYPFDEKQIQHIGILSQDIIKRYPIPPYHVVGHADIAPRRKLDPGILFPWGRLYKEFGIGAWLTEKEQNEQGISSQYQPKEPLPLGVSVSYLLHQLQTYGYEVKDTRALTEQDKPVIHAFQMHFSKNQRTAAYLSPADREDMVWAWGLNAKYNLPMK